MYRVIYKFIQGEKEMENFKIYFLCICLLLTNDIYSAEHQIKMLSSSNGQMMVFEPPVLEINKGDTVRWISTQPGHNSVSINEMLPEGAMSWEGGVNEEISVDFNAEGVYGYKCTPHYILGMVGLIIVGDPKHNFDSAKKFATEAEKKFATGKDRFTKYFSEVK